MARTNHRVRILGASVLLTAGVLGLAATEPQLASADAAGTTAWSTPGSYVWTVPAGMDTAEFVLSGGQGGGDSGLQGGAAGEVDAAVAVTAGEQFYVVVGGHGSDAQSTSTYPAACSSPGSLGGYGGGGAGGGPSGGWLCEPGAGGGGESAILTTGGTASDRILVAGGGGGASQKGPGGDGGGLEGAVGEGDATWPTGGTQTGGGTPGQSGSSGTLGATDGIAVNGGTGGILDAIQYPGYDFAYGGGGGGAGWYGGGGGALGGGAGGSSHVEPSAFTLLNLGGVHTGNGVVTVTYGTATAPVIHADTPGSATVGQPYSYMFQATGFPAPRWSVAGSLPAGLTLSADGVLSGTPTAAGSYTLDVLVDSSGGVEELPIAFQVNPVSDAPRFVPGATPKATLAVPYSHQFVFQGTPTPHVELRAGALPGGLSLSSDGTLSGTPAAAGSYRFTIEGVNGISPSATHKVTVVVLPQPVLTIAGASAPEPSYGHVSIRLQVSLSRATSVPVTVDWSTADGTARAGVDYRKASGQLTIAAGKKAGTITVRVIHDAQLQPGETFAVDLESPSGATLGQASGTVTIG